MGWAQKGPRGGGRKTQRAPPPPSVGRARPTTVWGCLVSATAPQGREDTCHLLREEHTGRRVDRRLGPASTSVLSDPAETGEGRWACRAGSISEGTADKRCRRKSGAGGRVGSEKGWSQVTAKWSFPWGLETPRTCEAGKPGGERESV